MRIPCPIARWAGRSVVLLLVATLVPSVSLAQTTGDTTSTVVPKERMLPSLSLGTFEGRTIRVTLGLRTLVCRSSQFTPAGIAPLPSAPGGPGHGPSTLLPWGEVERIDVRGSSAQAGAILGGVMVGLLATALGAAVASNPSLGKGASASGIIGFTMAGPVSGAVVGALLGSSVPSWKNVCRRGGQTEAKSDRSVPSRGAHPQSKRAGVSSLDPGRSWSQAGRHPEEVQ